MEDPLKLPLLLAGPILRRTSARAVYVWLAISELRELRVRVFSTTKKGKAAESEVGSGMAGKPAFQLESLHIYLVAVAPVLAFPLDHLLSYVIEARASGEPEGKFEKIDIEHVSAAGRLRPCFMIPGDTQAGEFWVSSCRKLSGLGVDAGLALDALLGERLAEYPHGGKNARKRTPHPAQALFLVGDQIYADDLSPVIYNAVFKLTKLLFPSSDWGIKQSKERLAELKKARLIDADSDNVAVSLYEICALYLLYWSSSLWPIAFGPQLSKKLLQPEKDCPANLLPLHRAYQGVIAWRRLFANVPTYMLLDDHEVVDDWNMMANWTKKTVATDPALQFAAATLGGYLVFQALGNDPSDPTLKERTSQFGAFTQRAVPAEEFVKSCLVMGAWSFVAPTQPPFLFLDGRTARWSTQTTEEVHSGFGGPPRVVRKPNMRGLVDKLHARRMLDQLDKQGGSRGTAHLVLAAPLMGCWPVEDLKYRTKWLRDPETLDLEGWHDDSEGLLDFLDAIADEQGIRKVVVLSGDVHYSYVVRAKLTWRGRMRSTNVFQCTASATKNEELKVHAVAPLATSGPIVTNYFRRPGAPITVVRRPRGTVSAADQTAHLIEERALAALSGGSGPQIWQTNSVGVLEFNDGTVRFRLIGYTPSGKREGSAWIYERD